MIIDLTDNEMRSNLWRMTLHDVTYRYHGAQLTGEDVEVTFLIVLKQLEIAFCEATAYYRFIALDSTGTVSIFDLYRGRTLNLEEYEHGKVQEHRT